MKSASATCPNLSSPASPLQGLRPNAPTLLKSGFVKNLLLLMCGTAAAQLLGLALMPLLSRLYTPAQFGLFGSFSAVLSVLAAGATLQFAQAIVLPKDEQQAAGLFVLSCGTALALASLCLLFSLLMPQTLLGSIQAPGASWLLWLLPLAVLAGGLNQALQGWSIRCKCFRQNAASMVARAGLGGLSQAGLGLGGLSSSGLVTGSIVGEVAASLSLAGALPRAQRLTLRQSLHWAHLRHTARAYLDFPLYATPQNVLNAASQGIPVLLLAHYFGAVVAGSYAVALRLLQAPVTLVLNSLRQVLLQRATEVFNAGQPLMPLFVKATGGLLALMIVPSLLGFVFLPQLFRLALGAQWSEAGLYARWLIPWLGLLFCNAPAVLLGRILRQQRNLMLFDLLLLGCRCLALVLGGLWLSPLQSVIAFSLVGAAFNLAIVLWIGLLVARQDQTRSPAS